MAEARKRRIVRRAAMAMGAVVLLLASYMASLPHTEMVYGPRYPTWLCRAVMIINEPLYAYLESDLPGSSLYYRYYKWCYDAMEN